MRVRIRQVVLMLIQTALATTALLSPDAASALTISSITSPGMGVHGTTPISFKRLAVLC